ncbi:long-chain fatty acid--CoA ligase [Actinomadura sp. CNU-125]|uniref:AMP-binding protein n=1 Tax=Actinomadura sp. CNU-125 TaxID=1904961 RepID=UPI00096139B9|nr:AMP-binding protein [Actinomadura sp. CNU-125]OLT23248.1 long-chain fatty acid--CoA ligase [Actinomadura sp. CNU-125]
MDTKRTDQPHLARRSHWTNHLERHAATLGDRAAIRFDGSTTTWVQLRDRVHALAQGLSARGVGFGDRVALVTGNRPEFVEIVLAANLLGAIAVPINFRLTGPEAAYILADSGAKIAVGDELGAPIIAAALKESGEAPLTVAIGARCEGFEPYSALLGETRPAAPMPDVPEDAPALIMYTSGTTGSPKGAVLTHLNLQAQALTLMRSFQYVDEDEVGLIASPLFHIAAVGTIAPLLFVGGTIVIHPTRPFVAGEILDVLESEAVTSVFLVPTQWQALCGEPGVADRDLGRLRVLGWGAAPATDVLLRRMADTFPAAMNVAFFGQTEMSPITCVLHGKDAIRKLGSVGRPVATVTVRVVDADMADVAPGEVGEIVYRGPGMMLGYWNDPEATAEAFRGGWFHSGDLVRVDEEGFVSIVDRAKDMIISGGENIYCAEVENVLADHPDVAEVALVGSPDPVWGETPIAFAVLRDTAASLDIADLREWASASLAKYKLPTGLRIVEALPRNASGMVLKNTLREQAGSA